MRVYPLPWCLSWFEKNNMYLLLGASARQLMLLWNSRWWRLPNSQCIRIYNQAKRKTQETSGGSGMGGGDARFKAKMVPPNKYCGLDTSRRLCRSLRLSMLLLHVDCLLERLCWKGRLTHWCWTGPQGFPRVCFNTPVARTNGRILWCSSNALATVHAWPARDITSHIDFRLSAPRSCSCQRRKRGPAVDITN